MSPAAAWPIALVLAGGALMSLQAPTNGLLARAGGSPVLAALISFAVGTLVLLALWLASGHRTSAENLTKLPSYAWLGGM